MLVQMFKVWHVLKSITVTAIAGDYPQQLL